MRQREPWQHDWERHANYDGVKRCLNADCPWQMLSSKNSNRYRNGSDGKWVHSPKDCKGTEP